MTIKKCATLCGWTALLLAMSQPLNAFAQNARGFKDLVENFENLPINAQLSLISQANEYEVKLASLRPNPSISIGVENVFGSSSLKALNAAETTIQISQDLQSFGRKQANMNYARTIFQSSILEIEVKRQEYIRNLALSWLEYENANYQLNLTEEKLNAANEDLSFISLLVIGGREPKLRQLQAQADTQKAKLEKTQSQSDIINAKNNLATISQYRGEILQQQIFMEKIPKFGNFNIAQNANYKLLMSRVNTGKAAVEVAKTESKPNLGAYIGARHIATNNAVAMVGGINFTMPLGKRSQSILSQKNAQSNADMMAIDDFVRNSEGQRLALIAKINGSGREISQINSNLPQLEEVYSLSKIGLKAGKINLLEVQAARGELFTAKEKLRAAKFERARAEIELSYIENRLPFEVANEK